MRHSNEAEKKYIQNERKQGESKSWRYVSAKWYDDGGERESCLRKYIIIRVHKQKENIHKTQHKDNNSKKINTRKEHLEIPSNTIQRSLRETKNIYTNIAWGKNTNKEPSHTSKNIYRERTPIVRCMGVATCPRPWLREKKKTLSDSITKLGQDGVPVMNPRK